MKKMAVAAAAAASLFMSLPLGAAPASATPPAAGGDWPASTHNQSRYPLTVIFSSGVTGAADVPAGNGDGGVAGSDWSVQDTDEYTIVYELSDPDYSAPITFTFHGQSCTVSGQPPADFDRYGCSVSTDGGSLVAKVHDHWT
ncbi:hypothetical protein [Streptomyces sp. NPDC096030]|uniref:hypothetical protein n=1 Tax=Streptomyces sp. NPDC096030 TaxID=3155423 RepID=UPI00331E72D9